MYPVEAIPDAAGLFSRIHVKDGVNAEERAFLVDYLATGTSTQHQKKHWHEENKSASSTAS